MITFSVTSTSVQDSVSKAKIFFVKEGGLDTPEMRDIAARYMPNLFDFFKQQDFTGKATTVACVPASHEGKLVILYFAGLGNPAKQKDAVESYRRSLGAVMKAVQKNKEPRGSFALVNPEAYHLSWFDIAKETAIIARMALYHFDQYITDKKLRLPDDFTIEISVADAVKAEVEKGLAEGTVIAKAVNKCRFWIDLPPCDLTPIELADKAQKIAQEHGLGITVFDEATIKKMGMGGLAAVSSGSDQDCRFVVMEYKTSKKNAPTLAFVGKGITFDSGGINLKPRGYIETMKDDMSGAAAVIATMEALAILKPEVNVLGITPLSENLPSGKAVKPGDIVTFYNGKTAEIQDTDAEGRLVLADALSYAVKHYKPDAIIDIATLTGACAYALGPFFTGLMSVDDALKARVFDVAATTGDRVWELPLHEDYKPAIKSSVADLANVGSKKYLAGAITAACFLQNFVDDVPWVHLDIAGSSFDVPGISYYAVGGATGAAVRLLVALARTWEPA